MGRGSGAWGWTVEVLTKIEVQVDDEDWDGHAGVFVCLQVVFALNQTLLLQESLRAGGLKVPYTTEDLIRHYNCGDLNSIIFNHDGSQVRRSSHLCSVDELMVCDGSGLQILDQMESSGLEPPLCCFVVLRGCSLSSFTHACQVLLLLLSTF